MTLRPSPLQRLNIFNSRGFRDYLGKKSFWSKGKGNDARLVKGLSLTSKKRLIELAFVVVEARIEARMWILDTRASSFEPLASIRASSPLNNI
jgi:hypothetical protein